MLCRLHQQVCLLFYAVSISKCDFYTVSASSASVTSMLCRLHNQFDCFARLCSPASVTSMLFRLHQQVCLLFYAVSISKCVFYAVPSLSASMTSMLCISISKYDFYAVPSLSASVTSMLCVSISKYNFYAVPSLSASVTSMLCRLHQQV